jgi:signal transduction histidine kinase
MGLGLRLFLLVILPMVLVVSSYGLVRIQRETSDLVDAERRNAAAAARAVQIAVENALRDRQIPDMRQLVAHMVAEHPQIDRLRIFDRGLESIAVEPPATAPAADARVRRVIGEGRTETAVEPPGALIYALPLRGRAGDIEGAVEIVFVSSVQSRLDRATWDVVLRVGVLTVVLAVLASFVLQREVLRPVSRLTESIRALGEGRPGPPLPVDRSDQLGAVAEAFNRMVGQLEAARARLLSESDRTLELERQLREAGTLAVAGKLTSAIAHEVGTPLNIISGRAEILKASRPAGDPERVDLDVIVDQTDRISGTIRSLLDTVRHQKSEMEAVSLAPVVDHLVPLLGHMARRRGITIAAEPFADLPPVAADRGQLQQVLINLVMNAIDATPAGGRIALAAWSCPSAGRDGVAISVTDTGTGIPPEALGKIFDAFYTTKPPGQGTGLGLSICRDIVRDHEGTLAVRSAPGEGSTFTVWLPRHEAMR